jgi:type III secretory pathway component EscS
LRKSVLGIIYELFQALITIKISNIVNAIKLVEFSKQCLQVMKDDRSNSLFEKIPIFCAKSLKLEKFIPLLCGALL